MNNNIERTERPDVSELPAPMEGSDVSETHRKRSDSLQMPELSGILRQSPD
jgi:hypothetical protein